jgi:hypothetical protein
MTEPNPTPPTPPSTRRLRIYRAIALAGTVGLCISAFLPQIEVDKPVIPAQILTNFDTSIFSRGVWIYFTPFLLFAPMLLVLRVAALFARRPAVRQALGWGACLACFAVFMLADLTVWKGLPQSGLFSAWREPAAATILSWILMTALATLATLALAAAPARIRTAACAAAVGAWCSWFFICVALVLLAQGADVHILFRFGLWVSLASSLLMTVGGIWETKLLWRRRGDARVEERP